MASSPETMSAVFGSSLSSLNSQLMNHGWTKRPLNLEALGEREQNDVVAVLFELLGASVTNLVTLDDLSARHRTLQYEHERLSKALGTSRVAQARMETEVAGWRARCAHAEKRLLAEEAKTKELREEVNRGLKAVESVRIAAGHETKKVQIKLHAAQAKLVKLSSDASLAARPQGLYLLNPIPSSRSAPVASGQAPLLEQSLRELADLREGLQEETEAFRHVIVSTANGLREILAFAAGQDTPARLLHSQFFTHSPTSSTRSSAHTTQMHTHQSASSTSHPSIADSRLRSLLAEVRTKLSDRIVHIHTGPEAPMETPEEVEAKKRAEREEEKRRMDLEDRVKDLEVEVVCARGREEEARKAMEEFAKAQMQASLEKLREHESEEQDEIDAHNLVRQKVVLEEERKRFTEATIRLGQERRQLELDRQAFLDERRKTEVEAMLAFLPTSPVESGPSGSSGCGSSESGSASSSLPQIPPVSWAAHRPLSPSPLSPHRPRTPKSHMAGKRRTKPPLSRLVLEKAARQQREGMQDGSVLGESSRRSNAVATSTSGKGKEKAVSGSSKPAVGDPAGLKRSARAPVKNVASSNTAAALTKSVGRKVDLSKADGLGPNAAAKGQRVWR